MPVAQLNSDSQTERLGYRLSLGLFIFSFLLTLLLAIAISTIAQETLTSFFGLGLGFCTMVASFLEIQYHARRLGR